MNRIIESLQKRSRSRFHFVYGVGVSDSFFFDNQYVDIIQAFNGGLLQLGFKCVVHASPLNIVRCIDDQSRTVVNPYLWSQRDQVIQSGVIQQIETGPFGIPSVNSKNDSLARERSAGLGDIHGFRMIDSIVRDPSVNPVAVVFYDADVFTRYFEGHRLLWGLLGEWQILGNDYPFEVFLICPNVINFSFTNSGVNSDLRKLVIENTITNQVENVIEIGPPPLPVIDDLLTKAAIEHNNYHNEANLIRLSKMIVMEKKLLKEWQPILEQAELFTVEEFRINGWISSANNDPRSILEKINDFVGCEPVKKYIRQMLAFGNFHRLNGTQAKNRSFHMVFVGNPGTGKTTAARLFGQLFQETGILQQGHLIETQGSDFIANHVGGTSQKTNQIIDRAINGILFIDEAYSLSNIDRGGFGQEALEIILKRMEDERDRLVVILAGYKGKMVEFLQSNPGLTRRFSQENIIDFPDFTDQQLIEILVKELSERGLCWDETLEEQLPTLVRHVKSRNPISFGNAGEMRNLAERIEFSCKALHEESNSPLFITMDDLPESFQLSRQPLQKAVTDILAPLDKLVGLDEIKDHLISIMKVKKLEQIKGSLFEDTIVRNPENYLFLGNPGTGKTTVARLLGEILFEMNILASNRVVETSSSDLIAGYVGQTSMKTRKIIEGALGGVLFIDEAYAIAPGGRENSNHFGQEAVDTIVKYIDLYKEQIVVILAGYPEEMVQLLNTNPGLKSRFTKTILFRDFTQDELVQIFNRLCLRDHLKVSDGILVSVGDFLLRVKAISPHSFGNAREVEKFFNHCKHNLAKRVITDPLRMTVEDLREGWNEIILDDLSGYTVVGGETPGFKQNSLLNPEEIVPSRTNKFLNGLELR